jgi:hypothetical protein
MPKSLNFKQEPESSNFKLGLAQTLNLINALQAILILVQCKSSK